MDKLANENTYKAIRVRLGLSREEASELLESITPERLERIENGKFDIHPEEVKLMADKYKQIILEMLSSLNSMKKSQERLIEITADGKIDNEELEDFIFIQSELERISITVETLQLWAEQMIADGKIDIDKYNAIKNANQQ